MLSNGHKDLSIIITLTLAAIVFFAFLVAPVVHQQGMAEAPHSLNATSICQWIKTGKLRQDNYADLDLYSYFSSNTLFMFFPVFVGVSNLTGFSCWTTFFSSSLFLRGPPLIHS